MCEIVFLFVFLCLILFYCINGVCCCVLILGGFCSFFFQFIFDFSLSVSD